MTTDGIVQRKMNSNSNMNFHHILRIYIPEYAFESRIEDVLNYCRRTGCGEVLLFTSSYDMEPSFKPLDEVRAYTEKVLKPAADRLLNAGITVSVNVMQTLGHIYFPEEMQKDFPFQRRISKDGAVSHAGACPLCKNLQQWVCDSYRIYAELQPATLFIDDDFRTEMDGLSCFCEMHLGIMSERCGRPVTRKEVVAAIYSNKWPVPELRKFYFEATTAGFANLAANIRSAVKSVSPLTRLGVMTANWPSGASGIDWDIVLQAMSGDEIPLVRPQIAAYSEGSIRDLSIAFMNPDRFRAVLPDRVEFWPEIENYPFTAYSKSARSTVAQMFSMIMNGFNHHALDLFDFFDQRFEEHETLIGILEQRKVFFQALHALIPEGSRAYGVKACVHKDALLVRRSQDDWYGGRNLANFINNMGLPLTHSGDSDWQLLCGDDILAFNDAELDAIMSKGALMDTTAAEALALRGQAERIGVRVGDYIPFDQLGYEEFNWPEAAKPQTGRRFPLRLFLGGKPDWRKLIRCGGKSISASVIRNFRRQEICDGMILTENAGGERFAVLAFSQQSSRRLMENRLRTDQVRHALEWIARKILPFAVTPKTPYLWPIVNRTVDNKWIIGIINLSTDRIEMITAIIEEKLSAGNLTILTGEGARSPVAVKIIEQNDQRVICEIPCSLEPLEYVVLIFEQ